ncbi:MAG: FkbM family methyltransferase [Candidatus Thermoplasmatota archaeon]
MLIYNRKQSNELFGYFEELAKNVGFLAIDVGARAKGNEKEDLAMLRQGVDWLCLEPDKEASKDTGNNWKSISFEPYAASKQKESFILNLYKQRGCSSKYQANTNIAQRFSRENYFKLENQIEIKAESLDNLLKRYTNMPPPSFIKIDVQGMEVECFAGSHRTLKRHIVGIRTEVSFFKIYKKQPLFPDVDQVLRKYDFQPMKFLELHHWRRSTRTKLPKLGPKPMPYSKGQMAHGDILYLLPPDDLPARNVNQIKRLIRLGLVSLCYDLLDHAQVAFKKPEVRDYCLSKTGKDPVKMIYKLSNYRAKKRKFVLFLSRILNRLK